MSNVLSCVNTVFYTHTHTRAYTHTDTQAWRAAALACCSLVLTLRCDITMSRAAKDDVLTVAVCRISAGQKKVS